MIPDSYWGLTIDFAISLCGPFPKPFLVPPPPPPPPPVRTHIPGGSRFIVSNQPDDWGRRGFPGRAPWTMCGRRLPGSHSRVRARDQGRSLKHKVLRMLSLWCCVVVTLLNLLGERACYYQEFSKLVSSSAIISSFVYLCACEAASCAFPPVRRLKGSFGPHSRTPKALRDFSSFCR